jgi:hypothetical protein
MKRQVMKNAICELRAAGWRVYLDGRSTASDGVPWDFLPWDDDLIPGVRGCRTGAEVAQSPAYRCRRVTADKQASR